MRTLYKTVPDYALFALPTMRKALLQKVPPFSETATKSLKNTIIVTDPPRPLVHPFMYWCDDDVVELPE